jgi:hypothetical protein
MLFTFLGELVLRVGTLKRDKRFHSKSPGVMEQRKQQIPLCHGTLASPSLRLSIIGRLSIPFWSNSFTGGGGPSLRTIFAAHSRSWTVRAPSRKRERSNAPGRWTDVNRPQVADALSKSGHGGGDPRAVRDNGTTFASPPNPNRAEIVATGYPGPRGMWPQRRIVIEAGRATEVVMKSFSKREAKATFPATMGSR